MTKKNKLTKAQEALKQRILNAYRKRGGFRYVPPDWGGKLWKKPTAEIYEFIEGRFRDTLDVVEYYSSMVFLWKTIPEKELLVEWPKSENRKRMAQSYVDDEVGTYNHKHIELVSVLSPDVNICEHLKPVKHS